MKCNFLVIAFYSIVCFSLGSSAIAQNPIIRDQYSADPSGRVFNGKVYVFPSHDILAVEGKGRPGWFCMEDYHVFSSENLTDWTDHGMIVSQYAAPWVDSTSYSMWAPDCIERNGKYYFYFPANIKKTDDNARRGFGVGVAVADKAEGPYAPQAEPIAGIHGIDPNIFIDHDGQAYIYWSAGNIFVAKLKENMLELDSEPQIIANLPEKGLKEGPYLFERNGIYYLTFPHVENKIERLEYAIGDNPMGPFKMAGVIMDESPMNCWTVHHSFINYENQWYLFYHQNAYSPKFDKNRSICMDSLFFNADGTMQKVVPTNRGVGISRASDQIQLDRFSAISEKGAGIEFLDTLNTFKGWKTIFNKEAAWVKYNTVEFKGKLKTLKVKAASTSGAVLEVHLDRLDGPVIAEVKIPAGKDLKTTVAKAAKVKKGLHHLVVVSKSNDPVEVDWIQFAK